MPVCPACLRRYDAGVEVCSDDGAVLTASDPLLGSVIDAKYRLDAILKVGGMGAVYRATHLQLQRPVAIKIIRKDFATNPTAAERFKREALAVARLKHPNIVTIFDFGSADEVGVYLVMELLDGRSLREELRRRPKLPIVNAVQIAIKICAAVHAAHQAGVIHRDIKPDNILLEKGPRGTYTVKVVDFGIAQVRQAEDTDGDRLTNRGEIVGTPEYMSPEQARSRPPDARSDVYSIACVLYEMVTGRPPFEGPEPLAILVKQVSEQPRSARKLDSSIPERLDTALLRALAKNPDERFQTAEEMGVELETIVEPTNFPTLVSWDGEHVFGQADVDTQHGVTAYSTGSAAAVRKTRTSASGNLPEPMTSFVGRVRQVEEVTGLLGISIGSAGVPARAPSRSAARLLTLVGPGGIGKTRLALRVAHAVADAYQDGVWLAELGAVTSAELVAATIAAALGVKEQAGRSLVQVICEELRSRNALIVLDNCEHVVSVAADIVDAMLRTCPHVTVLATSQQLLGVEGEVISRVPTLEVIEATDDVGLEAVRACEAARLFADRVALAAPGFQINAENASTIAKICECLEGIPLAIELAAARARVLSLEQILDRLDDRFHLLTSGIRTGSGRHQTLRAAVEWSFSLLEAPERVLMRRLAVFAGGFVLDAVETVSVGVGLAKTDVLDLLQRLVDKSLVSVDDSHVERRYRLLETIRQFCEERLVEAGEVEDYRRRHFDWVRDFGQRAELAITGPAQSLWLARAEQELDNIRAALAWAQRSSGADGLELAAALGGFWEVRGHYQEGRHWIESLLEAQKDASATVVAKALRWAGFLALRQADLGAARTFLERCVKLRSDSDDPRGTALTLYTLGNVLENVGEYERAEALCRESLELCRALGDRHGISLALSSLGVMAMDRSQYDLARELLEESLAISRDLGDDRAIGGTLHNLGEVAALTGDLKRATELLEESIVLADRFGSKYLRAYSLQVLGNVATDQGNPALALDRFTSAIQLDRDIGDQQGIASVLEGLVVTAWALGDAETALRLAGAARALRGRIGFPVTPAARERVEHATAQAAASLDAGKAESLLNESDYEYQRIAELMAGLREHLDRTGGPIVV